jgi:hypothetical protein
MTVTDSRPPTAATSAVARSVTRRALRFVAKALRPVAKAAPAWKPCPLKPIGYAWSYLVCRIGRLVPVWQPLTPQSAHNTYQPWRCASNAPCRCPWALTHSLDPSAICSPVPPVHQPSPNAQISTSPVAVAVLQLPITEINRIELVLSSMQNRTFGPYLAATNRILVSLMSQISVGAGASCRDRIVQASAASQETHREWYCQWPICHCRPSRGGQRSAACPGQQPPWPAAQSHPSQSHP